MKLSEKLREFYECEMLVWFPTIEKDFGQERFFPEDPSEILRSGKFNKVPMIVGRTEDEYQKNVAVSSEIFFKFIQNFL